MPIDRTGSKTHQQAQRVANPTENPTLRSKFKAGRALTKLAKESGVKESTLKALMTGDLGELAQTNRNGTYKHSAGEIDRARAFFDRKVVGARPADGAGEAGAGDLSGDAIFHKGMETGSHALSDRHVTSRYREEEDFIKSNVNQRFAGEAKRSGLLRGLKQGVAAPVGRSGKAVVADGVYYAGTAVAAAGWAGQKGIEKAKQGAKFVGKKLSDGKDAVTAELQKQKHAGSALLNALKGAKLGSTDRYQDFQLIYQALNPEPNPKATRADVRDWVKRYAGRAFPEQNYAAQKQNWGQSPLRRELLGRAFEAQKAKEAQASDEPLDIG